MNKRLRHILKWCSDRHIGQVYAFFRGCDTALEEHQARIYIVCRRPETVADTDEVWIESMERTIQALNDRKAA